MRRYQKQYRNLLLNLFQINQILKHVARLNIIHSRDNPNFLNTSIKI